MNIPAHSTFCKINELPTDRREVTVSNAFKFHHILKDIWSHGSGRKVGRTVAAGVVETLDLAYFVVVSMHCYRVHQMS
ncbi:hypothetical protein C0J52_23492 [Blattella germanica]|nr:hypothetical protein C0J52_23492 [Blattella germanica]